MAYATTPAPRHSRMAEDLGTTGAGTRLFGSTAPGDSDGAEALATRLVEASAPKCVWSRCDPNRSQPDQRPQFRPTL